MRIGIEAQRIFRPGKAGMDVVALNLIKQIQLLDKDNEYFVFSKDYHVYGVIKPSDNMHLHFTPRLPYPVWEQFLLPNLVKRYGLDLLHCTANTAPLSVGVPLILHLHDTIFFEEGVFSNNTQSFYQRFGNLYRRLIVAKVARKSAFVITVSQDSREKIISRLGIEPARIGVVYNGVDSSFYPIKDEDCLNAVRLKYSLPREFLLVLGNRNWRKNLGGTIRAYSFYHAKNKDPLPLLILGINREYLPQFSGGVSSEVMKDVIAIGYVYDDLPAVLSMAKALLFLSLREGFGLPILEAMSCGTPVICSKLSAMPETAGNAAIFVDPLDPEQIAAAIEGLLADKQMQQDFARLGLNRAAGFSWERAAREVLGIYDKVLGSSAAR